jgi:hypothetical protein
MDTVQAIKELNSYENGTTLELSLPKRMMIAKLLTAQQQEIEQLKESFKLLAKAEHKTVSWYKGEIERLEGEQWISVEDRLPEDNKEVLVFHEYFTRPLIGMYVEELKSWSTEKMVCNFITHWQPLPKAPEVG